MHKLTIQQVFNVSSPDSQEKKFYEKHGFQNIGKYFGHNNLMLKTFATKDCLDARR